MPLFKSKAQIRWAFATHPKKAKKWADEAKAEGVNLSKLPEHVKAKKKKKSTKLIKKAHQYIPNPYLFEKKAWIPPKRLWGELSEDAWKALKNKGVIKSDREILKGVELGNKVLLGIAPNPHTQKYYMKLKNEGYKKVNDQGFWSAIKNIIMGNIKKNKEQAQRGMLKLKFLGPYTDPKSKIIHMYRHPRYGLMSLLVRKRLGLSNEIGLRHEIDEARAIMRSVTRGVTPFRIRREMPVIGRIPTAQHMNPSVIIRESNNIRPLSKANKMIRTRNKSGEGLVIKSVLNKRYGRDYLPLSSSKKLRLPYGVLGTIGGKIYNIGRKGEVSTEYIINW